MGAETSTLPLSCTTSPLWCQKLNLKGIGGKTPQKMHTNAKTSSRTHVCSVSEPKSPGIVLITGACNYHAYKERNVLQRNLKL